LLMRYAGRLFGRADADVYLGGILVSWISFVLAMVALFLLARLDLPRRQAVRAVLLTAIFPFGFFFGMVYTEALFLLLAVSSFYAFRTRRWMVGGVCGGLATHTRHRHPDAAGARVARVAERGADATRSRAGDRRAAAGRRRHRRLFDLRLSVERQRVRVGGVNHTVGIPSRRPGLDGARAVRS